MTLPSSLNSGCVNALASLTASLMALIPVFMSFDQFSVDANLTTRLEQCSTKFSGRSASVQGRSEVQYSKPLLPAKLLRPGTGALHDSRAGQNLNLPRR